MMKNKRKKLESIVNYKKVFKEAEPQQQDKITGTVRKLAGMFFVKKRIGSRRYFIFNE